MNQQLMAGWKVELVINPTRSNQVARINVEHTNLFMPTYEQFMPHALHQYVIADGKITLYQRDDVKDGIWQCRMNIKGNRGYVRRSTGETSLEKAKEVSLQIMGELKQRKAQNLPMTRKTFVEVAAGYLRDAQTRMQEGRNSAGRYAIIKGTVNRYLVPYFANRDIALIVKKDLMEYRAWRQSYWITGPGRAEIKRDKKPPTQATLKQEWTVLRGVFLYGMDTVTSTGNGSRSRSRARLVSGSSSASLTPSATSIGSSRGGYRTDPDDLVFCHEDGLPIENWVGFSALLKAAGLEYDTHGNKRSIYSLRHTYATFRLQHGTNVYWLKKNMGTSVAMIERHYGQTNVLIGIEHETAKRKKAPKPDNVTEVQHKPLRGKKADELVPIGAVDLTPAEEDGEVD